MFEWGSLTPKVSNVNRKGISCNECGSVGAELERQKRKIDVRNKTSSKMLNKDQNVQECDATEDESSNEVG